MSTSAISSTSSTTTGDQYTSNSLSDIGSEEFLTLLVAQLQYQDPLEPMDNTEFVTQLAQFSTLESMQAIQDDIEDNNLLLQSVNNAYSTSMIGKEIKAEGDNIYLDGSGSSIDLGYSLDSDASEVEITIYDEDGNTVKTITIGGQSSGTQAYTWDGKDSSGNTLSSGTYTYEVSATDSDGNSVSATTYTTGVVDGVVFEDGVTYLTIGDDKIKLGDIVKVSKGSSSTSSSSSASTTSSTSTTN